MAEALKVIDEVSRFALANQVYLEYDGKVLKRLQNVTPQKPSPPIHTLLATSTDKDKETLSKYCYRIEKSKGNFETVLKGLEAHYQQINARDSPSKGKIIDNIIRNENPKDLKEIFKVLWVIGSLALLCIRDADARAIAEKQKHKSVTQKDKADAIDGMWAALLEYNDQATREAFKERVKVAIRWDTLLRGKEVGTVVVLHILSPSL